MKDELRNPDTEETDKGKDKSFAAILKEVKKHMCEVYCLTNETHDVVSTTMNDFGELHLLNG